MWRLAGSLCLWGRPAHDRALHRCLTAAALRTRRMLCRVLCSATARRNSQGRLKSQPRTQPRSRCGCPSCSVMRRRRGEGDQMPIAAHRPDGRAVGVGGHRLGECNPTARQAGGARKCVRGDECEVESSVGAGDGRLGDKVCVCVCVVCVCARACVRATCRAGLSRRRSKCAYANARGSGTPRFVTMWRSRSGSCASCRSRGRAASCTSRGASRTRSTAWP